ncbi:hypothetical protein TNCV_2830491 [Trichonephila clavipes]|nr:hypothetical protein TNCV_2830491 [Trichonephila clavipes]
MPPDFAMGGSLFQTESEHLQPLAFFSLKLSETEKAIAPMTESCLPRMLRLNSLDTLSRIASIHVRNPTDYNEIAKAQENDSELINNPQGLEIKR